MCGEAREDSPRYAGVPGTSALARGLTAALLEAFAVAIGCDLPPTIFRASHRWRFARTDRPLGVPFLWDPDARLGVCGDWTFGGRVESAFLSGDQVARAILGEWPVPAGAA
jgi:hypothetical protein